MEYGVQMYSVRDLAKVDLAEALKKVAELGYKFVEFASFYGHTGEEVKAMLEENGLGVSGVHSGMDALDGWYEETVQLHKTIGNTDYILPVAPYGTKEELEDTIAKINKYQPLLSKEGITMTYHNHSGEFLPNQDGQIAFEELEKRTSVYFEIDTYWAYVAGKDPVELISRLKDRVRVIHLKDGLKNGEGFPLGNGTAPVEAVRKKAIELGLTIVVESETLKPDGVDEVTRCMEYLSKQCDHSM